MTIHLSIIGGSGRARPFSGPWLLLMVIAVQEVREEGVIEHSLVWQQWWALWRYKAEGKYRAEHILLLLLLIIILILLLPLLILLLLLLLLILLLLLLLLLLPHIWQNPPPNPSLKDTRNKNDKVQTTKHPSLLSLLGVADWQLAPGFASSLPAPNIFTASETYQSRLQNGPRAPTLESRAIENKHNNQWKYWRRSWTLEAWHFLGHCRKSFWNTCKWLVSKPSHSEGTLYLSHASLNTLRFWESHLEN